MSNRWQSISEQQKVDEKFSALGKSCRALLLGWWLHPTIAHTVMVLLEPLKSK